jgi:hypothetical protein
MGGFVINDSSREFAGPIRIRPSKLLEHFEAGDLAWPSTSDGEIDDHSKADWVVKSLALLQAFWFIVNLLSRWSLALAITILELYTLGIVICGVVTFSASWEKPFDVNVPIILQPPENFLWSGGYVIDRVDEYLDDISIEKEPTVLWAGICLSLVFGAIHIAAWNFHFASFAEQLIWRIASVSCTAIPVFLLLSAGYLKINAVHWWYVLDLGVIGFYAMCRLCLFVEMFTSLRAVPRSVYQTPEWTQYTPSFG